MVLAVAEELRSRSEAVLIVNRVYKKLGISLGRIDTAYIISFT